MAAARDGGTARSGGRAGGGTRRYDFAAIERKWRDRWEAEGLDRTPDRSELPKYYALTMFPYPSGDLHIGHWYAIAPSDTRARYMRMRGHNVLFPIGFDAFGLPAENAAIRRGVHPHTWTMANIQRMRGQLRSMGAMFDWSREVVTADPSYYRWNQWFFLQLYRRGLAYKRFAPVDWCPSCRTTLAREQVIGDDRHCERCQTPVVRKELDQWFFRITAYAEELLDFSGLRWPDRVAAMQRNWIGRSEGVQFRLEVDRPGSGSFEVFTTRIDTLFGVTFAVLAPEHPLVDEITTPERRQAVEAYRAEAVRRSEIERLSAERVRTGVWTGAAVRHPLTGEPVPVWVADYVLTSYGTGAIMGVPAHDARDFDFARRHGLPVRVVVAAPADGGAGVGPDPDAAYEGPGRLVGSGPFDGLSDQEARAAIAAELVRRGIGRPVVQYRLRDWLISRQRYWGTPIPIVYCASCGTVPVPEDSLPVRLPEDAEFLPTGESPLLHNEAFRHTVCPRCGGPAERETDTMDTFVDSSWYQYRYLSPHCEDRPFDPELARAWLPVDVYTGGVEHATMHLLYTRFFTKAMRDLGLVDFGEPMIRLYNQGIILGENSEKMSKSRGNVVSPDDLVARYGADAVRVYLMFIGPWDQGGPWNPRGIEGAVRFLGRVWRLAAALPPAGAGLGGEADAVAADGVAARSAPAAGVPTAGAADGAAADGAAPAQAEAALRRQLHDTIRRVGEDLEDFAFNTAISALMTLVSAIGAHREASASGGSPLLLREAVRTVALLLAPFAPHLAEEVWERAGGQGSVHRQPWPAYDPRSLEEDRLTVVVQVNGRVRDRLEVPARLPAGEVERLALESPRIRELTVGRSVARVVSVPGRLVNIVVR